ncbi:MAG: hypothetical protein IAF38_08260 [Bacteroidia bacterium]|nr:hypothetical protein [Bacteroidia bacterium]
MSKIKKIFLLCLLFFFAGKNFSQHQHHKVDSANVKHPHGIYLALGPSISGIDIYKTYLQNPHRVGINARVYGEYSNRLRLAGGFTRITKFNYAPSWKKLGAFNVDLDLHFMARVKDEHIIFYGVLGLCYHQWNGYFRGQSAFYDAIAKYKPNTYISQNWVGLNVGLGFERAFKYFDVFAEYRYRFAKTEVVLGIADVAVNIGIKKKIHFEKIFRGVGDKYRWF